MMMTLGLFVFMLKTVPFQQLQLQQQWRHASNNRVGLRPSLQFLGPDSDVITLSGVLMPAITGGRLSMQMLELMAETGKGWPLLKGNGTIYGMFVIENIGRTESEFFSDGSPRKIEFTVTLKRMDESLSQMLGDLSGQLTQLKDNAVNRRNAERAAKATWERLQRGVASFSIGLALGREDLFPELPVKVSGFKQQIDEADWIITTVTNSINDNGFTTSLELEVKITDLDIT